MGSWKDDRNEEPKGIFYFDWIDIPLVIAIIGVVVVSVIAFVAASPADGFWPKTFVEVVDVIYTLALVVGGGLTLTFAVVRLNHSAKQTFHIQRESERKDRTYVSESLRGAVKMLRKPADSMKYLAIAQMAQLGKDYPAQTLEQIIGSLCAQAREYHPHFSENDLINLQLVAKRRLIEREWKDKIKQVGRELEDWEEREVFNRPESEITNSAKSDQAFETRIRKNRMAKKLVGVVNDLNEVARTGREVGERPIKLPINLCGVDVPKMEIRFLEIIQDTFGGCRFRDVQFRNCTFKGYSFSHFGGCHFTNCTFEEATFNGGQFERAVFSNCTFIDSSWQGGNFRFARFLDTRIGKFNSRIFCRCEMTNVAFGSDSFVMVEKLRIETRGGFLPDDFEECYIKESEYLRGDPRDIFPKGLEGNVPPLEVVENMNPTPNEDERVTKISVVEASADTHIP